MATYYVRTTGSDAAAGTSAGTAWLTLGKALGASGIASGDTVYVGAGVYREAVTVAMTTATAETKIIGDVDGSRTGDAGEIRWTTYTTNDKTAAAASNVLTLTNRDFLTFEDITFGGGAAVTINASSNTSTNITFRRCLLVSGGSFGIASINANPPAVVTNAWLFDSCILVVGTGGAQGFLIRGTLNSANVDYDLDITFQNSLFWMGTGGTAIATLVNGGSGTGKPGGIRVKNCTAMGGNIFLQTQTASNHSTTIPCEFRNSVHMMGGSSLSAATTGQIVEDYNVFYSSAPRTNVSVGANSFGAGTYVYAPLFEFGQAMLSGREARQVGVPTADSGLLAFGSDPAVSLGSDLFANTRTAPKAVGAMERPTVGQRFARSGGAWVPTR